MSVIITSYVKHQLGFEIENGYLYCNFHFD